MYFIVYVCKDWVIFFSSYEYDNYIGNKVGSLVKKLFYEKYCNVNDYKMNE